MCNNCNDGSSTLFQGITREKNRKLGKLKLKKTRITFFVIELLNFISESSQNWNHKNRERNKREKTVDENI